MCTLFFPEQVTAKFGELSASHPGFLLAVWSPAIAAFAIVTYYGGVRGLRTFFSRLLLWRCPAAWYAYLFIGFPLVFFAGSAVKGNLFSDPNPSFFLSGTPQRAWGVMPFFVGSVCLSVILTPLLNVSHGSILLAIIYHFQANNPLWPDAQPYDPYFLLAVAVLVVWLNRRRMFTRVDAVTEVIPVDQASFVTKFYLLVVHLLVVSKVEPPPSSATGQNVHWAAKMG